MTSINIPEGATDAQIALILAHFMIAEKNIHQQYIFNKANENLVWLRRNNV